ncbi:MAG: LpqB family beta-propeller domain-containing protein [Acidobacteriota bacterium]
MPKWRFVFVVLVFALTSSPSAWGEEKRPMTLVDLLEVPSVGDPQLSRDGLQVLYRLQTSDWRKNRRIGHIWRININGADAVQMTNGPEGESSPRWSPDGKWIAFLAKRDPADKTQIYVMPNRGGEAHQLTHHETAVSRISWAPDGSALYFLASDPKSKEQQEREKHKDDVFAFDENYQQRHLWNVSWGDRQPDAKAEEKRLTEGSFSILGYDVSRDGSRIAHHRAPTPLFDDSDESEVWIMQSDGSQAIQLTRNTINESQAQLSADNSEVLFVAGANQKFETYYNRNLFLVGANGGESTALLPDFPYEIRQARWSTDGQSILAVANMGVHSELISIDLAAQAQEFRLLTSGEHALRQWSFNPTARRHVFSVDQAESAGDLWTYSAQDQQLKQVTHVFDPLKEEFLLPHQERIQWKGADGQRVEGLLIYPLHFEKGKKYPLIVQTHGGPASADNFGFGASTSRYNPVLAAKGYLVLKPNYRGSTGYGNAFLRDMVGHYFKNAHLDVLAGVDYLIQRGLADPDRLIKMGWSAGGHMTNKIITFTARFKAASSGAGAVNWISMYGQSDVRIYRTPWFGGTPWQENAPIQTYWENSPLKDIAQVKTPTLILVGEKDVRVPSPQSIELYRALKSNGVPTRLYIAPREPHGWRELRHRLFKMNVELEWFAKYALGREYVWEKPPSVEEEGS